MIALKIKKLLGLADVWDLASLRIWSRRKTIKPIEAWDAVINCQGKIIADIDISTFGDNGVTLTFTDGSKFKIDFTAEIWEYNGRSRISTDVNWRLEDETVQS